MFPHGGWGWPCCDDRKFDGAVEQSLFSTDQRVLSGVSWTMAWMGNRPNSPASPLCLYAHFTNTSSTTDFILLGGGNLSWQRPQHRLIHRIPYVVHLLLAPGFYINTAFQSLLLFCSFKRNCLSTGHLEEDLDSVL